MRAITPYIVGKRHWGAIDTPGENPCHFGFDTNITGTAAGGLATYLSERNYGFTKDRKSTSPFAIPGLELIGGLASLRLKPLHGRQ